MSQWNDPNRSNPSDTSIQPDASSAPDAPAAAQTDEQAAAQTDEQADAQPAVEVDPEKLEQFLEEARSRQSFPMAVIGGVGAAAVGAALWWTITVATDYQIGFMAIGVGALVGITIRMLGKGITMSFGILGAVLSVLGCAAGNLFTVIDFAAQELGMAYWDAFTMFVPGEVIGLMKATFHPIDLLFYALAVYFGYQFSFRQFSQEELAGLVKEQPAE